LPPGIGTRELGGSSTNHVLTVLDKLAELLFVGSDCVEVAPAFDHVELTCLAGRIAARGA
jgi:agmatinase